MQIQSASQSFGDRRVVISCDEGTIAEAKTFLTGLVARVNEGFLLRDGAIVPLGWAHLVLRTKGSDLAAYEPNYATNPVFQVREDCTTTLSVHREMIAQALVRGESPVFPHFMDRLVAPHGWRDRPIIVTREERVFRVSFEGAPEATGELRLYELLGLRPGLLPRLAIAVGASVSAA